MILAIVINFTLQRFWRQETGTLSQKIYLGLTSGGIGETKRKWYMITKRMIEMTMIILIRMKIKCVYHDTIPYPRGVSWSLFLVRTNLCHWLYPWWWIASIESWLCRRVEVAGQSIKQKRIWSPRWVRCRRRTKRTTQILPTWHGAASLLSLRCGMWW